MNRSKQSAVRSTRYRQQALRRRLFLECLEDRRVLDATPVMLQDVRTDTQGSNPASVVGANGITYFAATDRIHGTELWKSDGTEEGTVMVADINPGLESSGPTDLTIVNGMLYFRASTPTTGFELWTSDGTAEGTEMVKEIAPGAAHGVSKLFSNGVSLFLSSNDGIHGEELWTSDGTSAGTQLLKDIAPGPGHSVPDRFAAVGGNVFLVANDGVTGIELWVTDGTELGTRLVKDIRPGAADSGAFEIIDVNGTAYFRANDGVHGVELWKSDGTEAGTVMVADIRPGSAGFSPAGFTPIGGVVYFKANDGTSGEELWRSDGTEAGTYLVADILPGTLGSSPAGLTELNGEIYFRARDAASIDGSTWGLWKSDGTPAGTTLVMSVPDMGEQISNIGGVLVFESSSWQFIDGVSSHIRRSLWSGDGSTAGTEVVKTFDSVSTQGLVFLANANGMLYFRAADGATGLELWRSDGTALGTKLIKDISTHTLGSQPRNFTALGSQTLFFAATGLGWELVTTDGTVGSVSLVKDINPGIASSGPSTITVFNGKAYFQVNDGVHGHEPWVTDGTEAGTHLLADINPGTPGSEAREFFEHAGKLFFSATDGILGHELWVTDGTEAGTHLLADINPGPNGSAPTGFFELGDELLFTATDGSTGLELWKTDGTQTGAILVKDINPGAANGFDRFNGNDRQLFAEAGGNVFFLANSGATGFELWKTDGTEAGTMLVKDINPGPASAAPSLQPLHSFEGKVYFAADDGVHGVELWASDGTEAGTALVKDINSAGNSLSGELPYFSYTEEVFFDATTLGHEFFFVARSQENGAEVWKSDGTTLGTQLVKDINPGAYDAFSWETNSLFTFYFTHQSLFVASGGALYFTPVEPNFDRELWRTDGTESGTYRVADINPFVHPHGVASGSNPSYLTDINGTLYFAAATPQYGNEPWIYAPFANQSPTTAGPISSITNEDDIPYIIDLLSGASDPDPGDVLSVTNVVITGDASGLTLDGNSLHVDPAAYNHFAVGESVVVEVDYVIVDGQGGSLAQSATITINGQNDAPLATNDQVIVPQGSSENAIAVLANDADPDTSDTLLIQSVSATARNATAVISPDQTSILYTPRTPTSTGIDTFTYTVIDPWGAPATATITVTILANTVVVEPIGLEAEVLAQQSTPEEPLDVVVNVNPLSYDDVIAAVNSLPPVAEGGQTVFVTLAVSDGTYAGATISPPPGVVVIINGYGGSITIVGASPALTISSGTVIIQDGVLLTNTTDAPTIMVTGGHLIVRNSTIEESTNFARAGIEITGGTADLGTTDSPGGNTFIVHGEGEFIVNTSGNDVSAVGNVFVSNNAGNDLPLISAIGDQQYTQTELTVQIEALDPDNDPLGYSVAFASKSGGGAVNDPTDFSIDALGLFHWTPGAGQLGQYTFEALVSDGTQQISQQFTITTLGVVDGVLTIVGTSGIDRITVKPTQGNIDLLSVTIHGKDFNFKLKPGNNPDNPYNDVQRVLIHALGGDDHVDIHNRLLVDTEIHGGAGDDRLKGGDGHDVIFGGMGDDLLNGADGNDFLIGGDGRDKLHGQKGNDILLAGRFAENFDTRFANLRSISAAWAAGFANNDLTDDNEDDELLDELAGDLLSGGQGADWFIVSSGDQTDFNVKKNKDGDLLTIL